MSERDEIDNIKRLAGITEADHLGDDHGNYPQGISGFGKDDGSQGSPDGNSVESIADNFINGNQKDAFQAIGGNIALFAQVVLYMRSSVGKEALMSFLNFASRRGQ
jgi:hypothetical protein